MRNEHLIDLQFQFLQSQVLRVCPSCVLYYIKGLTDDFEDKMDKLRELYDHAMESAQKVPFRKQNEWTEEQKVFLKEYVAVFEGSESRGNIAWSPMKENFKDFYHYHPQASTQHYAKKHYKRKSTSGHPWRAGLMQTPGPG